MLFRCQTCVSTPETQQAKKLKSHEMMEGWMKNKEEWWRMNEEWMKNEWRMMKDEEWMLKLLRGFADWLTDRLTDGHLWM